MVDQTQVWTQAEIDQNIANLKAGIAAHTASGAPVSVNVDGVDVVYTNVRQMMNLVHRFKKLKENQAGTRRRKIVIR